MVRPAGQTRILAAQLCVLAAALAVTAFVSTGQAWADADLVATLAVLAIGTHVLPMTARGVHISGSFMGLVLAMALLGPAPAVAIALAAVLIDATWTRPPLWHLVNDLVTFAVFPLVGGVAFEVVLALDGGRDAPSFALAVGLLFMVVNLLNFVLIVEQRRLHDPATKPLGEMVRLNVVPVLPWQMAAALVTSAAAYGHAEFGVAAIGVLVMILFTFQLLLRAVLESEHQADELNRSFRELGEVHRGLLAAMLNTLSLRDPMTARHSAAVARYALAIAEAAGLSEVEQELVHTAGLLHDIGKASFDDALLTSSGPLTAEQVATIRRHPTEGARILRAVPGYERVADVVEAHHERLDGGGYPRGLAGEEIPVLARVLSVADTYDVMTGRDTYREPVGHEEAVAELRRVAGSQLDARFVELFVETVERQALTFAHADDRDLELELRRPRVALA